MSTGRRSSRLPLQASPEKDDNTMNVDEPSEDESIEDFTTKKTPSKRVSLASSSSTKSKAKKSKKPSNSSEMDLFAIISDGAVLSTAVTDWLDTYCSNADGKLESTAVLVQLIFQTALLTGDLPKEIVSNSKVEAINEVIDERLEEVAKSNKETPEFPLTPKSKTQRKFQSAYARFWKVLVEEGSDSAFSDDFLLNRLITWLTRLVYAPYRPLRFAAAVSAFYLMKSLVTNLEKLTSQLSKRQKQIESEAKLSGKKSGGASSSTPKSKLESDLKAMKARGEIVEKAVKKLWSEVFGAVWHDQSIEMRRLSIEALGEWCIQYPKYFMDSDRFKYLVWLMGDSDPGCRATALQVLLELLDKEDLRTQMRMYSSKLIERLYNLAKETSHDHVAIHAILVLARLRELFGADFVNSEVVEYVQHQVSVDNPDIRAAAGTFITVDIVGELEEGEDEPKKEKSGKNSRPNSTSNKRVLKGKAVTQLRNMLNFIENSTDHTDMPYYVVDAIWDNDKDFFLFAFGDSADLMLIPSTSKQRLSDSQQSLLAKSVLATVSRLSGKAMSNIRSAPIPKADVTKQLLSSFTETYYPIIPELLLTHQADHDVLIPVLSLANHLDMDHLAKQADGKKSALLLIQNIKKIFTTTTQEAVLKKCSSVLEHLASNSTLQRNVDSTLVNVVSSLTETLNTYVEKFDVPGSSQVGKPKKRATELESADFVDGAAPGTAELVLCLLRLEVLSRYFDLNRIDSAILEAVVKVVETRGDGRFRVVGPRSAFSATTLFATLVAYKFNELPIGDPNNTSKSIDQMDYDVSQRKTQQRTQKDTGSDDEEGKDNDDEDDNEEIPKKKARNSLGGAKPKAKQTIATAALPMPTERELLDFAALVSNAITKMLNMLDLKADDTDMEDLAPFAAFRAISSLLLLFSRKLTDTPLQALVYKPTAELVAALIKFFEAEMEKPADEYDASVRCETVLNSFTSLIVCDIFEDSWEAHLPKVIAQLRQENEKSQTMVRNLLKDLRDGYGNPAPYAQLLVDTLAYELQLKSDDPETQGDDEDKAMRMRRLTRSLERSFPIGKDYAANACKLVINKLVEQSLKDPDFAPLLTWATFFVVKVTPAGARDLLNSFKTRFDVTFASLEGLEAPYEELKQQLNDRATGTKRAKATGGGARGGKKKTAKKIKDVEDEDEDRELENSAEGDEEDDQASQASSTTYMRINPRHKTSAKEAANTTTPKKAAAKKAVTKTESAKKSATTPKRASAKRAGRASISVIHQGNSADVSMGADSEMAHTDDEASDHEDLPKTSPAVAHPKRPAVTRTSIAVISTSNREEEEGGVAESMDVDEPVTGSQMSVEIPMTDSGAAKLSQVVSKKKGFTGRGDRVGAGEGDLEESLDEPEPRTSRPKRGRLSHLSQVSETSAASPSQRSMRSHKKEEESEEGGASEYEEEDHPESDVDSDDLMDHTPSTKRRRAPSRS